MSNADEIQAAIDKLTDLKDDSVSIRFGWLVQSVDACTCAGGGAEVGGMHEPGCGSEPLTNDPLTLTLHATIDAQLAILRAEAERQRESLILPWPFPDALQDGYDSDSLDEWVRSLGEDERDRYRSGVKPLILALARSINGEARS